jgi:hypothetical protein
MKDVSQKSTPNDVLDEFTCFYAPYAAVTAVDGPTFHRARMARLSSLDRMTRSVSDVPGILDRVTAGDLLPLASAV